MEILAKMGAKIAIANRRKYGHEPLAEQLVKSQSVLKADALNIEGNCHITGTRCHSHGDHRITMSLAIAALFAHGETIIEDPECTYISYPKFYKTLAELKV